MDTNTLNASPCSISWASIIGGAAVAASVSLVLLVLGAGLGWATVSPWSSFDFTATQFTITAAIWLILMQWLSSAFGGYIAGRLRSRWSNVRADEVMFRDTAHGFLAWALATILVAGLLTSTMSTIVKAGGPIVAASQQSAESGASSGPLEYPLDTLFRTSNKARVSEDVRSEASRLIMHSMSGPDAADNDKAYLADLVSANTGVNSEQATQRVDALFTDMKVTADKARKAGSMFAMITALSMVMGAFVASLAGAIGGRHRDEYSSF